MWHEARKQERKIRGMLVDYRKRAERRRDFYEKIKADPTQFLQIHGRQGKIHLDPAIAAAAEGPATMMPWQGQPDNLIDRFDVRAHLDFIPPVQSKAEEDVTSEERQLNYERYRIIAQNAFLGINEEKFLKQLHLEEQFGYTENEPKKKKPTGGAAIGFNYEDSTPVGPSLNVNIPTSSVNAVNEDEAPSDDNSDSDLDVDLSINISKIDSAQAHEMNRHGRNFGMSSNDFYSFLTNDLEEAESFKLAKEEEHEKALFSGRKSRRERRAHREKRLANRKISPPSYAAKESASFPVELHEKSESRSPSPDNSGKITFITSFGDEEEPQVPVKVTYADKVKLGTKLSKLRRENSNSRESRGIFDCKQSTASNLKRRDRISPRRNRSTSRNRKIRRRSSSSESSRSSSRSRSRSNGRSNRSSLRSRSRTKRQRKLRRHSSRTSSSSGTSSSSYSARNRRKRRLRSSSSSRSRSRSKNRSRSRSRSSRSLSRSRSRSKTKISLKKRSRSRSSSSREKITKDKSKSPLKDDSSIDLKDIPTEIDKKDLFNEANNAQIVQEKNLIKDTNSNDGNIQKEEIKALPRYYGRRKSDQSSSEIGDSSDDDSNESPKNTQINNLKIGNSGTTTKIGGQKSATMSLAERLKRKRQALLNKQFKADKIAEQMKTEREKQEQQTREDELRELALKLRRKQRERRHAYDSDSSQSSSSSCSKSASQTPKSKRSRSASPKKERQRADRRDDHARRYPGGSGGSRDGRDRRDYDRDYDRERGREGRERDRARDRVRDGSQSRDRSKDRGDRNREVDKSRDMDRSRDRERERYRRSRYDDRYYKDERRRDGRDLRDGREERRDNQNPKRSLVDY